MTGLSLDPGSWHHIVVTAVGTVASFYVNGSFIGGQSLVGSIVDDPNRNILLGQLFPCKLFKFYLGEIEGWRERERDENNNWKIFTHLSSQFSAENSFSGQMQEIYFFNQALTVR